jgi:hypothetical protein
MREEVAAMTGKYLLSLESEDTRVDWQTSGWLEQQGATPFSDNKQMTPEGAPFVYYTVKQQIMLGDSKGTFRPQASLSRKESAAILYRLIEDRIDTASLHIMGFYAIKSYPNIDKISLLDRVYMGWSHMDYSEQGLAWVNTAPGDWGFPKGWKEVIAESDKHQVPRDLVVFYDDANLADFLKDTEAQKTFISSVMHIVNQDEYGFGGVCLDFEGLKDESVQDEYVLFLTELRAKLLENNKKLTVALPLLFTTKDMI